MLDIETMDSGSFSAITSIGAVKFGNEKVDEKNAFYVKVKLQSCMDLGMTVSASTIEWWMSQSDAARDEMFGGDRTSIGVALYNFGEWARESSKFEDRKVWGNGATFDNVILSNAYAAARKKDGSLYKRPWSYKGDRCYRTLYNLCPEIELDRTGEHHNAKDDAITQARHLIKVAKKLGVRL